MLPDFLQPISFANQLYTNVVDRALRRLRELCWEWLLLETETRFWVFLRKTVLGAYYAGGFGRIEDTRVEEAGLALGIGSDGKRIGGPDHTMGGQSAKRTDDRDTDADTREASTNTGNRYGKGPEQGKSTR